MSALGSTQASHDAPLAIAINHRHCHCNHAADYDERILPSLVNEVVKMVVAQFTAAQLLTMREQVSTLIRQNLQERSQEVKGEFSLSFTLRMLLFGV